MTTDPVEIWAAPNSVVRQEKNYFDTRFDPFYRPAQIFIKAVGLDEVSTKECMRSCLPRLYDQTFCSGQASDAGWRTYFRSSIQQRVPFSAATIDDEHYGGISH